MEHGINKIQFLVNHEASHGEVIELSFVIHGVQGRFVSGGIH